jgi:murein DD-endopeptidase MepM/ murein hydrolase activator NlpD
MSLSPMLRALGLVVLLLAPALHAERDAMLRVSIEPGRDLWYASPVELRLLLDGLEPESLQHVDPSSFRLSLNGIDVTGLLLSEAARQGGVRFARGGRALELRCALPLPQGWHELGAEYRTIYGGGPRFAQRFYVYDENDIRKGLGLAPLPPRAQPMQPLNVTVPSLPSQAAPVFLSPSDKLFVKSGKSDLEVRWMRGGVGMKLGALKILLDQQDVTAQFAVSRERALWQGAPLSNGKHTLVAQVADSHGRLRVESATFIVFDPSTRYPWLHAPTNQPHPLAHTHNQFQNYRSGSSSAYFHHGIDVRRPSGTRVLACAGGNITNFYWYGQQPYYFEVEITDKDGFRWQYHHVDYPQIPQSVRNIAAARGFVAQGTDIGDQRVLAGLRVRLTLPPHPPQRHRSRWTFCESSQSHAAAAGHYAAQGPGSLVAAAGRKLRTRYESGDRRQARYRRQGRGHDRGRALSALRLSHEL